MELVLVMIATTVAPASPAPLNDTVPETPSVGGGCAGSVFPGLCWLVPLQPQSRPKPEIAANKNALFITLILPTKIFGVTDPGARMAAAGEKVVNQSIGRSRQIFIPGRRLGPLQSRDAAHCQI